MSNVFSIVSAFNPPSTVFPIISSYFSASDSCCIESNSSIDSFGSAVGVAVGASVGSAVGVAVGTSVGSAVGNKIADGVGSDVGSGAIEIPLSPSIPDAVGLGGTISILSVGSTVSSNIGNMLGLGLATGSGVSII